MDKNFDIQILIEKYFEGNTSIEEERGLKQYFLQDNIDPKLLKYRDLFQFFDQEKKIVLDKKLPIEKAKIRPMNTRIRKFSWLSIAASIALLIGIWFYQKPLEKTDKIAAIDWSEYEPKSTEEAYRQTLIAVELLSKTLGNGAKKAAKELDRIGDIQKIIEGKTRED